MTLSRDQLLAALKPNTKTVDIAGVGTVQLSELSLAQMDDLRTVAAASPESNSFALSVTVRSLKDDSGNPIFSDADIPELRNDSSAKVQALITAALTVNGLIADEAKKSPEATSADSASV